MIDVSNMKWNGYVRPCPSLSLPHTYHLLIYETNAEINLNATLEYTSSDTAQYTSLIELILASLHTVLYNDRPPTSIPLYYPISN